MVEKDYSLLRPFDVTDARSGELVCWYADGEAPEEYVVSNHGAISVLWRGDQTFVSWNAIDAHDYFRMAPLAWVEDKPVYREDVLYHSHMEQKITAKGPADDRYIFADFELDGFTTTAIASLTWNIPKMNREVKLLAYLDSRNLYWVREGTVILKDAVRVPSEDKTVEICA